jgi:hypothetical protein
MDHSWIVGDFFMKIIGELFVCAGLSLASSLVWAQHPTVPPAEGDCDPHNPKHLSAADAWTLSEQPSNLTRHVCWTYVAAVQGHIVAENNWGNMLAFGQGVDESDEEGLVWTKKAADQGYGLAEFNLAIAYEDGHGTAVNMAKAKYWMDKAYNDPKAREKIEQMQESAAALNVLRGLTNRQPAPEKHYCSDYEKKNGGLAAGVCK